MKELSIEEKAKRYDEALIRGSRLWESDIITRESYEYIFPELRESENERIRKSLIVLLQHFCKGYRVPGLDFPVSYKDMLAWLEKQGKNNMGISEVTKQELKDNLNKALAVETGESWNEFLDEQKPAWSEEDEEMYKEVLTDIIYAKNDLETKDCLGLSKRAMKAFNWFSNRYKSLRPQNWTKEDKERYISCLQRLGTGNPEQPETINSKWFKEHVYPQSIWKPSDEQMENLNRAFNGGTFQTSLLMELYQDLKKLK